MNTVFDKIIALNGKLGEKLTMFLSSLIFSFVFLYWILRPALSLQYLGYVSVVAIFFAALLSIYCMPEINRPNKALIICTILIGLFYMIAAVRFREDNKLYKGLSFAVFVPLIMYLLSNKNNRERFIGAFVNGGIFGLIVLSVASALMAPIFDGQYSSITLNPNYLSVTASIMYVCVISKLFFLHPSTSKWKSAMLSICAGLSITLILLSQSRTGLLCIIISSLIAVIVYISDSKSKNTVGKCFKNLLVFILIVAAIIPCFHSMIGVVSSNIIKFEAEKFGRAYFFNMDSFIEIDAADLSSGGDSADISESLHGALERSEKGLGLNTDDISTGRFGIWKSCFNSLNMSGHADTDKFYAPYRGTYIRNSHNMFLEIGFDTGYPGFISVIAYMVFCFILYFRTMKSVLHKKETGRASFFFLTITPVFVVIGMLSDAFFPTLSIAGMAFWFTVPANKEY